jgi:hypothetical protein
VALVRIDRVADWIVQAPGVAERIDLAVAPPLCQLGRALVASAGIDLGADWIVQVPEAEV